MTDDYDPAKDSADSYTLAVKEMRLAKIRAGEIIPWKRKEVIGDITLYQGDCVEIAMTLPDIDSLVSDPPFGMSFQSNHRTSKHKAILNDGSTEQLV
ncbi:MAG: hypothetical protein AAF737_04870, partial [Pseudomonadota bacterium]